jgi:predicted RNase H-like HicB family nuclease
MENLKQALQVIITTTMSVDKALDDKQIQPLEWAQIAIKSIGFWRVVKNIDPIKEEFRALSNEDRTEIIKWLELEFDLRNDNLEETIEKTFNALLEISTIFSTRKRMIISN